MLVYILISLKAMFVFGLFQFGPIFVVPTVVTNSVIIITAGLLLCIFGEQCHTFY